MLSSFQKGNLLRCLPWESWLPPRNFGNPNGCVTTGGFHLHDGWNPEKTIGTKMDSQLNRAGETMCNQLAVGREVLQEKWC